MYIQTPSVKMVENSALAKINTLYRSTLSVRNYGTFLEACLHITFWYLWACGTAVVNAFYYLLYTNQVTLLLNDLLYCLKISPSLNHIVEKIIKRFVSLFIEQVKPRFFNRVDEC